MIGILLLGPIILLILARRNESKVEEEWDRLSQLHRNDLVDRTGAVLHTNANMADLIIGMSLQAHKSGNTIEAIRLLKAGCDVIARFTPNLLALITTMARFSRMVSAITPVQPLFPADFRMAQLASLAYLHGLVHHFLVTGTQKFRLKLYVLGKGISMVTRYMLETTRRIATGKGRQDDDWRFVEGITADYRTLSRESVESFQQLVQALSDDMVRTMAQRVAQSSAQKLNQ